MENEMKSVVQCLMILKEKGFTGNFEINDRQQLLSRETNETFGPEDIIIENAYRFEGDSNPDDMSIIYSITAKSGTRGILMDAYGTYSNPVIDEFIKSVPFREENELQDTESK